MKKEFKLGETFSCGLIKLRVENGDKDFLCKGCYCGEITTKCDVFSEIVGECMREGREDGNDVIFVKVE